MSIKILMGKDGIQALRELLDDKPKALNKLIELASSLVLLESKVGELTHALEYTKRVARGAKYDDKGTFVPYQMRTDARAILKVMKGGAK